MTVAVLSTGVDGSHPDLTGTVTTGPDFAQTGRGPGQAYWADEGTAVAGLIAGHGHGSGGSDGVTGIAPGARILSVQVTLEYNDPLDADAAVTGRLPAAIAAGIRYAVAHGATVISLPLDPGMMGARGGAAAAAGGSQAERAAVAYAISRDVLLVAPAGDSGGGNAVNYPAAYPGVIAVGATARDGALAPFTNTGSYVALTAPGAAGPAVAIDSDATAGPPVGLTVAAPGGGYQTLASTDMASALTAGVAALIRGRYPWLTAAEVTQAIEDGATAHGPGPAGSTATSSADMAGWGHGALNAGNALARAAAIAAAHPRPTPSPSASAPAAQPAVPGPATAHPAAAVKPGNPGRALRSVLRRRARRRLRGYRGPDLRAGGDLGSPPEAVRAGRRRGPRRPRPRPWTSLTRPAAGPAGPPAAARSRLAPHPAARRHRRGQRLGERQPERPPVARPGGTTNRCPRGSSRRRCSRRRRSPRRRRRGRCQAAARCTCGTRPRRRARSAPSKKKIKNFSPNGPWFHARGQWCVHGSRHHGP